MKNLLVIAILLSLLGCGEVETFENFHKELGIELIWPGNESDKCLEEQAEQLVYDWFLIEPGNRERIKVEIAKVIGQIEFLPTKVSTLTTGEKFELELYLNGSKGSKFLESNFSEEGEFIEVTQLDLIQNENESNKYTLQIQPYKTRDESLIRAYRTDRLELYDTTDSVVENLDFFKFRQQGKVWLEYEKAFPRETCAGLIRLSDIIRLFRNG